jgi:hypothetical protein
MNELDPKPDEPLPPKSYERRFGRALLGIGFLGVAVPSALAFAYTIRRLAQDGQLNTIIANHIPAIVGIPLAIMAAFLIVELLKGLHGPIRITSKLGEFEGATGPTLLWLFCFIALVWSIKLLWSSQ